MHKSKKAFHLLKEKKKDNNKDDVEHQSREENVILMNGLFPRRTDINSEDQGYGVNMVKQILT